MPETLNEHGSMEELGLMGRVLAVQVIARTQQEELHADSKALWLLPVPSLALFSCLIYTSPFGILQCERVACHVCMYWVETFSFFPNKSFCW